MKQLVKAIQTSLSVKSLSLVRRVEMVKKMFGSLLSILIGLMICPDNGHGQAALQSQGVQGAVDQALHFLHLL
jgi:hypothetical protein